MKGFLKYLLLLPLIVSCSEESGKSRLFDLVPSTHSHVDFSNQLKNSKTFNFIEYLYFYDGGGIAIGDINNDSLPDLFFTSNQNENRLYLNQGDFIFKDITNSAGVGGNDDWSKGVTMADVNADGFLDIYVSVVSDYKGLQGHNQLFINNGDLTFSEKSKEYGLDFMGFGTQAVFFDYDGDSDLDVYLLNHSVHDASTYGPSTLRNKISNKSGDKLLENKLNEGKVKFVEVTKEAGIFSSRIGYGLGVAVSDINLDGWPDIYVSNDFHENDYLYINQHNGTFSEELEERIGHTSRYSMGNDMGDLDNDGYPEIITLDMLPYQPDILLKSMSEDKMQVSEIKSQYGYAPQLVQNTLQKNLKNGCFSDMALYSGIAATDWSWSPLIVDLDNDGLKDLHITNGIFKRPNDLDYIQYLSNIRNQKRINITESQLESDMIKKMPTLKIGNAVFKNLGHMKFEAIGDNWGLSMPTCSNGSAYGDLDNDGDLDLVVNNVNQEAQIFRNNSDKRDKHFVKINLSDDSLNTNGIGGRVVVYAGTTTIENQVLATHGFESSSEPVLTVGLGSLTKIDSIKVFWTNGYQIIYNVPIDKTISIVKSKNLRPVRKRDTPSLMSQVKSDINFSHKENEFNDFSKQPLIPYRFSTKGPAMAIGDINADGKDDLYLGGAHNQSAKLFIQSDHGFMESEQIDFNLDSAYEDVDAVFVDLDGDLDLDVFVASGGGQNVEGSEILKDRIYINQKGVFKRAMGWQSPMRNSSCVSVADYDKDGDQDIFVGVDTKYGAYGENPSGYLLKNTKGGFKVRENNNFKGMITDAEWYDIDNDNDDDLVLVGHWMSVTIILNDLGKLDRKSEIQNSQGLWNCLKIRDLNNDKLPDIIAGNFGLNNKFHASSDKPLKLFVADFDGNGSVDPIIMHELMGRYIPVMTVDDLINQIPSINKEFNSYTEYANEVDGIESFLSKNHTNFIQKSVSELRSMVFYNQGNLVFNKKALPGGAQKSSINTILIHDINKDTFQDLILAGNFYGTHINLGRYDASYGELLINNRYGFKYVDSFQSGLQIKGEVRHSGLLKTDCGTSFIFALNNDKPIIYKITNP